MSEPSLGELIGQLGNAEREIKELTDRLAAARAENEGLRVAMLKAIDQAGEEDGGSGSRLCRYVKHTLRTALGDVPAGEGR